MEKEKNMIQHFFGKESNSLLMSLRELFVTIILFDKINK